MTRLIPTARLWALLLLAVLLPAQLSAAPFAAYVMDARTGQAVYSQNANARLHPASLTKMMTLYLTFAAIERGQVRLDSKFTVSSHAASEPPSKLGLRAGQQIELRYLIRAAAIKSANDAATAIGEGLAGSESAFAQQMTAMARALGMRDTQYRNAHGLTTEGHYSTAHDLSILGRHLFYDFPQYYNIFSRRSADAGIAQVSSTNRRFLNGYDGADGIKTGYTRAAGFNLTASAQRGNKRLIATVLGGTSTAQRDQIMMQLLDAGFKRVPGRVRETRPQPPQLLAQRVVRRAQVQPAPAATQAQPQRMVLTASAAPRPNERPAQVASTMNSFAAPPESAPQQTIRQASALALTTSPRPRLRPAARAAAVEEAIGIAAAAPVLASSNRPVPSPRSRQTASTANIAPAPEVETVAQAQPASGSSLSLDASNAPKPRSEGVILAAMGEGDLSDPAAVEIVRRPANSGRNWGISLGLYRSRAEANNLLLQAALQDGATLGQARRNVADTNRGFRADFVNLNKAEAELACNRLIARQQDCTITGP